MARLINIGFGNVVNSLIDATQGRKTKAVIVTSDDYLVLSALQPETIARRFAEIYENEDKGETHE